MNSEAPEQDLDLDSTLIRRGVNATTLTEIEEFAATVERRPLDKLLGELPGIAALSEMKFTLARQVIRRRARYLGNLHREQLRILADEIAESAPSPIAARIRELFA